MRVRIIDRTTVHHIIDFSDFRCVCIYVIYKPWLGGVYAEYTTRGRGQRKFAAEINPERSEGFIEAANFR